MKTLASRFTTSSIVLLAAAVFAGCSGTALNTRVGTDHPANPQADVSPMPESSSVLQDSGEEAAPHDTGAKTDPGMDHGAHANDAETTTYTCPMHPEVTSPKPGKCPKCGMDLKPKSA